MSDARKDPNVCEHGRPRAVCGECFPSNPRPPRRTPSSCAHENFNAYVAVNRLTDTGMFTADIKIACQGCGEPFRFLGVPPGMDFERPMCSIDGLELRAPIEPQGEPRLFSGATFRVPPLPGAPES